MKDLTAIFLALLFATSLNAQSVYTELKDGLIEKDYETFSFLKMGYEKDDMTQKDSKKQGYESDQNQNDKARHGNTGNTDMKKNKNTKQKDQMKEAQTGKTSQNKMGKSGSDEPRNWSNGHQDDRVGQKDKTQEYFSAILVYTNPEFPDKKTKKTVKHAIKHELISQGYEMDDSNPDFLVSYVVFNEEGKITGDYGNDNNNVAGIDRAEEYEVSEGTLLVSVVDSESGETVWSGFNDGAFKNKQKIEESIVIRAVSNVLDRMTLEDNITR